MLVLISMLMSHTAFVSSFVLARACDYVAGEDQSLVKFPVRKTRAYSKDFSTLHTRLEETLLNF